MYPFIMWSAGAIALLCFLGMIMLVVNALLRLRAIQRSDDLPPADADRRAQRLAQTTLSPQEYSHLRRHGFLDIPSTIFPHERFYRLPLEHGMIQVWENGICTGRLCLLPCDTLPVYDQFLALWLLIIADERDFLAVANHFSEQQVTVGGFTIPAAAQLEVPYAG